MRLDATTLDAGERDLCDQIAGRSGRLLEDLRWHVGMRTGGGNLPAIEESRASLVDRLETIGGVTERFDPDTKPAWLGGSANDAPDSTVTRCVSESGRRVLIAGHLDTVHDPDSRFNALTVRDDGTATGPGCVDMKGGLVIAVHALEALHAAGVPVSWSFFLNADEETGTYHSASALSAVSREHDIGIALEPALAGGELAVQRAGSGQFMIEVFGRSAHVGRAFTDGVSAVTGLARALVRIAELPRPERQKIVSVGPIRGGTATNAVPEHAAAWGNVRFPDQPTADEIAGDLDALASGEGTLPRLVVHRSFNRPAKPLIPETERLALWARAAAESLGQVLPFASTGGVCDGNIMQAAGLPTIDTLGVRGGGLHTPDEWIDLSSLVERCQLLAVLLRRLGQQ
ncbi:MAG: M20/M25/M40 family metallo-hydrolase [Phycisphaerales bacterium]